SGKTKERTNILAQRGKLNGFTLSAGFSTATVLNSSPHDEAAAPFLGDYKIAGIFGDFGIGYYLHRPDIQINLAYRSIHGHLSAYDFSQNYHRRALTLEAYKFFADYHGFAPFVGPALSYETLTVNEKDVGP